MRLIRDRAKIFNLNVYKVPRFTFKPLWFETDHTKLIHWDPHERIILDRAKLDQFYAKVQSKIQEERQKSSQPKDPFADFMSQSSRRRGGGGDPEKTKITKILELPFRSNFKFDFDLENAMNKILADACARYRLVMMSKSYFCY